MVSTDDVIGAVLAGGLGTRLRAAVADRPKVLAPVQGRPFVAHLLDKLERAGIAETVLLTGYMADRVKDECGDTHGTMRLCYSSEPTPRGTAGALRFGLPLLTRSTVLVFNGDSYMDLDLAAFLDEHRRSNAEMSLALSFVPDVSRYGRVYLTEGGRVDRFVEKQACEGPGWINAGVYLMDRTLIEEVPIDVSVSLERDLFPRWADAGRCRGYRSVRRFLDIGTPESYGEAEKLFQTKRAA